MKRVILELHDISPWYKKEFLQALNFLEELNLKKISLLVIPNLWNNYSLLEYQCFVNLLRDFGGEIILHGFTHLGKRKLVQMLWTDGEGEFEGLSLEETHKKVKKGKILLENLGFSSKYFVPPAWISNPYLEEVLWSLGFRGVAYRCKLKDLKEKKAFFSPVLTFSNRRWLSPLSIKLNSILKTLYHYKDCLRLAIHMADFRDFKKISLWKEIIFEIKNCRRFISYEELFSQS
ncbi:MAG: polysaccharide deacetylase family protein [Thermodesulfobacteriaceae bacterium]|nr:polysaccharide deacetylase family protein [Thermodesulfobacteriaceae bacterium]MCX8042252.1 polysaccharide deacetylase family protein [Thermodesulfobacteriaceae bacterium]MDW8136545.1 polysaccharide deacetylase family protein [Thermodesulfobacterium sp.]